MKDHSLQVEFSDQLAVITMTLTWTARRRLQVWIERPFWMATHPLPLLIPVSSLHHDVNGVEEIISIYRTFILWMATRPLPLLVPVWDQSYNERSLLVVVQLISSLHHDVQGVEEIATMYRTSILDANPSAIAGSCVRFILYCRTAVHSAVLLIIGPCHEVRGTVGITNK